MRYEFAGNIHATPAPFVLEGEDEGGMLAATGAGGTLSPNTRFSYFGQRPLGHRPQIAHLTEEGFLLLILCALGPAHVRMYMFLHTYTQAKKNEKLHRPWRHASFFP